MKREIHGESGTRLYRIWAGMKGRCHIKSDGSYDGYGGRGISVCDEWRNSFTTFKKWALLNKYGSHLTIDRINNNGNYTPVNCQWITQHEQVIRQDRFSYRLKEDRHIVFNNNKIMVVINKNTKINRKTISATFDNIEQARTERNFMEFCIDNNLKYKYPYYTNDVLGTKKGNREKRKSQQKEKIENMISLGSTVREISKKLKIGSVAIWRIKRRLDQELETHMDKRIQILSRMT